MSLRVVTFAGQDMAPLIRDVARLRLSVFREWPYLYDGSQAYEENYLEDFASSQFSIVVAAMDVDAVVGVATAAPLMEHTEEFAPLFSNAGFVPSQIFYCGESVLLPAYRGQGIGHKFFDAREEHGRRLRRYEGFDLRLTAFCGVVRAEDDPRCPVDYRPLDAFWRKRGYGLVPGLIGSYSWKEIGMSDETDHPMQFWLKDLD